MGRSRIRVIVPIAIKEAMAELAPMFTGETGCELDMTYMLNPEVPGFIANGAEWDLALTNPWYIDEIIATGHAEASSYRLLGRSPLAFARKSDDVVPPLYDQKEIAAMLSKVQSIAITNVGTSGDMFRHLAKKLGVWDAVKPAIRPMAGGEPIRALVAGKVEVATVPLSNIVTIPGIVPVAICPDELDVHIDVAHCVNPLSENLEKSLAKRLAEWLSAPARDKVLNRLGVKRILAD